MVPTGSTRYLARTKERLQRRRDAFAIMISQIESKLAQIEAAERVIKTPRNGKAVALPDILKNIPITQKDLVLSAVRSRRKSGIRRWEIVEKVAQQRGVDITVGSVSTYLSKL